MKYFPHEYQKAAIDFILHHPIAAVLLDMGLGKTSITLTAIESLMHDSFDVSRVLVIAPLRVAATTWPDEIRRWDHLKNLSFAVAVGTEEERRAAVLQDADITIINRDNLSWLVGKSGLPLDYDMVVIDELSSFKNWRCGRTTAFMRLRPNVRRVVGLTGTPSPNGLMDLFGEYRCLDMGQRLGRFISEYRREYFLPDKCNGPVVYSYRLRPGSEERIYDRISDITISMRAMDHLDMPELISNRYPVSLSRHERAIYDKLKRDLILPENSVTATTAAALSNKLSQLSNGCVYDDYGTPQPFHDRKLDALEDILEAATSPVLVCYWFQHDLDRIRKRLDQLGIVYEEISGSGSINRWNEGKLQVGLIHPARAGHGLNLQMGGHTMVWFSLTWSLELYEQCIARLWRQGQQSRTVIVTHIVTENTIDDRILRALESKSRSQQALIEAVKAELSPSTTGGQKNDKEETQACF